MIKINFINQYDNNKKYKKIIKNILNTGYKNLKIAEKVIISVVLLDNHAIHELNRQYRNIDAPTDVLSFENDSDLFEIGDVFISMDMVEKQASELQHSFDYELAFLALHGFLHCLGYDHILDKDNEEMNAIQDAIMNLSIYKR